MRGEMPSARSAQEWRELDGHGQAGDDADASGQTTYNYDNMDRLSSKVTPEGTLSYTYDAAGNLASISSSNVNGASMAYSYDNHPRSEAAAE